MGISSLGESARRSWGQRIAGCCRWWRKRFMAPICRSSWEQSGVDGKQRVAMAPSYGAVKNPWSKSSKIVAVYSWNLLKPIETLWGSTLWYPVSAWGLGNFFRGFFFVSENSPVNTGGSLMASMTYTIPNGYPMIVSVHSTIMSIWWMGSQQKAHRCDFLTTSIKYWLVVST